MASRDLGWWMPRLIALAREKLGLPAAKLPANRLTPAELHRLGLAVQKLSFGLTRERSLVGQRYLDDAELLAAYLLFYWPVSYAQVRSILGELPRAEGPVLDLGSGPGPGAIAALDAGAAKVLALDRSAQALDLARRLARQATGQGDPLDTQRWSPGGGIPKGRFALILAQHLLNELWVGPAALERRATLCRELLAKLSPGGTLLLVEPALRETSRQLLQLRDVLVAEGFSVRAPCLYRGNCQALDRPTDWCHAERDWDPPEAHVALALAAKVHKERLKMSYLALAPPGEGWSALPSGRLFRIVSEPLLGKGRLRYMGCGPEGRLGLALQDKHVRPANQAFRDLPRGEVIAVSDGEAKGDGVGLNERSAVELVAAPGEPVAPFDSVG